MDGLADTSVIVQTTRDKSGRTLAKLLERFPGGIAVASLTHLEIMLGAKDDRHRRRLEDCLSAHPALEVGAEDCREAARIWTELRRRGLSVSDPLDCCIAQTALSHRLPLLHRDRDFEKIQLIRPALSLVWVD